MTKPRHIALNVQDRDQVAEYYKKIFGVEEKYRGPTARSTCPTASWASP